jgi:RNA polymerase sigma-70 factor, ECF subfamily
MSGISRRGGPHPTTRENEAALLARARAGDHAAWDVLIRRHREALVAAAERAPCATYEDPEDLVQRALARAWRMRASIRPGRGAFQAWASRIVQRVGCDSSGAQRHQRTLLEEAALPAGELPGVANGGAPPPRPDEILAAREQEAVARRVVADCLLRLTALEAEVLFHDMQGGTAADFREAGGTPYSTAAYRQALHRARAKVRALASPWPLP